MVSTLLGFMILISIAGCPADSEYHDPVDHRTGQTLGIFGPETNWERITEMALCLIDLLTDDHYEIVEMPLNRRARRRLQRSGAPNPWHVVRHRIGPDPRPGQRDHPDPR